jgi:hypothetical protein
MTLYDLHNYEVFEYNGDVYRLISIDNNGNARAMQIAKRDVEGNLQESPGLLNDNFNPYAEVRRGRLQLTFVPADELL